MAKDKQPNKVSSRCFLTAIRLIITEYITLSPTEYDHINRMDVVLSVGSTADARARLGFSPGRLIGSFT